MEKKKKKYTDPEIEIIFLTGKDIITSSPGDTELEEEEYVIPTK